jgi:hypothetical protein
VQSNAAEDEAQARQRRAVFHTRADTWRTAAVMTCLLPPVGLVFGAVALVAMRGISQKIDRGADADIQRALRLGRACVLAGTGLGAIVALVAVAQAVRFAMAISSIEP